MEDKRNNEVQRSYTLWNPQKAHLTGEFVVVPCICNCMMLCLVSKLANVVRQLVKQ